MRLFLALCVFLFASGAQAGPDTASISRFIDRELRATGAPGVAFAVVDKSEVISGARGTTLAGGDKPVTPSTPFLIGSISKSFTALAIMQLAEAGLVDLDAPVAEYIDAFRDKPGKSISLRQLLNHTSGYSTVQGNALHGDEDATGTRLVDYIDAVSRWQPAYAPGSRWEYSNLNYQILGEVVETVSGGDYASYIEERIFAPLGMKDSFVSDDVRQRKSAIGHRPWFGRKRPFLENHANRINAPAGGVFSSADDLARYLAMMLNGRDDIISAAGKAAMLRPASEVSPFYGLGWFIDADAGTASHTGLVPGTETLATLLPAEAKGVVVLVNANGGIGFGDNLYLRNGITELGLGEEPRAPDSLLWPKLTYLTVMLLPAFFLCALAWCWFARRTIAAKSGPAGMFSLWFPLFAMVVVSVIIVILVPRMFGGSLATIQLFQPDFAMGLIATAILGPLWAIVRLSLAYHGKIEAKARLN